MLKPKYFSSIFLILCFTLTLQSCKERGDTVSCFPYTMISVTLNLNLPGYIHLQTMGWQYIDEQDSGTRGLIVYKNGIDSYIAYDRNAPHLCPDSDTTLEVMNGNKVVCPKDGAEWMLTSGAPIKGTGRSLQKYNTTFNPSTGMLRIHYN